MEENGKIVANEKKTVAEVIDYVADIEPHRCIGLWVGVGAGKNYFVECLINGNPDYKIPKLTVLIISSRKSKVVETLSKYDDSITCRLTNAANGKYYMEEYGYVPDECWKTVRAEDGCTYGILQRSVVCTNAYIEGYFRHVYDPQNPETHLWNRFDIIVWDEVHSLVMDSSYQSAPFYVARLFSETFWRMEKRGTENDEYFPADYISPRCNKLMLMSGTPEAIGGAAIIPELHELDLRKICINAGPRNIYFLDSAVAEQRMCGQLADGKRMVYFTNHVVQPEDVLRRYNIPADKLAVSFSDADRRSKLKKLDDGTYTRMEMSEKYLADNSRIHPDIQLFYTTSRNKEGINIEDTNIDDVYIESHSMTDIKQMAGRIRHDTENLYIIMDSKGYGDNENRRECEHAKMVALETSKNGYTQLNENLRKHCRSLGVDKLVFNENYSLQEKNSKNRQIISYIDLIESKSPYFEYDYILNSFCYNRYREKSRQYYALENEAFEDAYYREDLVYMFREAFPDAAVHEPESSIDYVETIIEKMKTRYAAGDLKIEDMKMYVAELDLLLTDYNTRKKRISGAVQMNRVLKIVGLSYDRKCHNKKSPNYDVWELKTPDNIDDMAG